MVRRISEIGALVVILAIAHATAAVAQPSTERLERVKPWSVQVAGGMEMLSAETETGRVLGAHLTARSDLGDSPAGLKASVLLLRRSLRGRDGSGQQVNTTHTLVGFAVSADVDVPIGPTTSIAPWAGVGVVPSARSSIEQGPGTPPAGSSQSGTMWTVGVTLHLGRFMVQQHLIGLLGAEGAIQQFREYYPIMVGWQF